MTASPCKVHFVSQTTVFGAFFADYTMSMMSIQAFYYAMQGPQRLYGLTFGAYDLTGMLMAPLFGAWSDKNGKFKAQFLSGGWINVAGNLIYAFTFLSGKWWMMLLARLVAGIGEATLGELLH